MLENEDSVVTSLNELRKLKHERITRQTKSRATVGSGRAVALAEDPASEQMTPPPVQVLSILGSQHAQSPGAGFAATLGNQGGSGQPSRGFDSYPVQAAPLIQTKTSFKAAAFVAVLLIGAGGAGYVKLQNDMQAVLLAKDASIKQAEEARNRSVEMAAKSDQQLRANLRQLEDKLNASLAAASAAAVTATPSAPAIPAIEKKAEKPAPAAKVASRASSRKPAARPAHHSAQAEPAAPKSGDVPNIAKKKKLDNDPLAGLGKL
jgi:hypothetical protein